MVFKESDLNQEIQTQSNGTEPEGSSRTPHCRSKTTTTAAAPTAVLTTQNGFSEHRHKQTFISPAQ
jgi:hypothetical protein